MRRLQTKDPTLVQVLSLYLLLLAFFVILFNASRLDRNRADAVSESLTATFRTNGRPSELLRPPVSRTGPFLGDAVALRKIGDLAKTEIAVAEIEVLRPGRLIRIRFPTDQLFESGTAGIRTDREAFVSEISALLGSHPPGLRHKVEVRIGSDWITPAQLGREVPRPVARAAALAETLTASGALSGTVATGIESGKPGRTTLLYRLDGRPDDPEPAGQAAPEGTPR